MKKVKKKSSKKKSRQKKGRTRRGRARRVPQLSFSPFSFLRRTMAGKSAAKRRRRRQKRAESQRVAAERDQQSTLAGGAGEEANEVPKTFVFGAKVGPALGQLREDVKRAMNPLTAARLKARHGNTVKDFVHVAAQYGVTHFIVFSETDLGSYVRFARVPRGPTLTFKIHEYSTCADVARILRRPHSPDGAEYNHPPLVVLNNFPAEEIHDRLMSTMLQGLFPTISVRTISLSECRRVVLFSYDTETKQIEFRQYLVTMAPVGASRPIKRVVRAQVPAERLSRLDDIADFVLAGNDAFSSDSERDDTEETRVQLQQDFNAPGQGAVGRATARSGTRQAIRLVELGPRMRMSLMKVEEGLMDGAVLHHAFVQKTPEEITQLERRRKQKERLRALRKSEQEANVQAKDPKAPRASASESSSEDDDAAWYEREVGEKLSEREAEMLRNRPQEGKKRKYHPVFGRKSKGGNADAGKPKGPQEKRHKK
jgi:ribosome biogenesis protein SSF1/2